MIAYQGVSASGKAGRKLRQARRSTEPVQDSVLSMCRTPGAVQELLRSTWCIVHTAAVVHSPSGKEPATPGGGLRMRTLTGLQVRLAWARVLWSVLCGTGRKLELCCAVLLYHRTWHRTVLYPTAAYCSALHCNVLHGDDAVPVGLVGRTAKSNRHNKRKLLSGGWCLPFFVASTSRLVHYTTTAPCRCPSSSPSLD